jgi:hypothetical protein
MAAVGDRQVLAVAVGTASCLPRRAGAPMNIGDAVTGRTSGRFRWSQVYSCTHYHGDHGPNTG